MSKNTCHPATPTIPVTDTVAAGAAAAALNPIVTLAGQVLHANPSDPYEIILPNGQTLSAGSAIATVDGSRISVGLDGKLIIAGSSTRETIAILTRAAPFTTTAAGAISTATDGAFYLDVSEYKATEFVLKFVESKTFFLLSHCVNVMR